MEVKTGIIPKNEIEDIRVVGEALLRDAQNIVITRQNHGKAIDHTADTSRGLRELEKRRKEITHPLNKQVKEINAFFRGLRAPFEKADKIMRDKLLEYHKQEEKRSKEIEQKLQSELGVPIAVPAPHTTQRGDTGQAIVSKYWTFEVDDLSKVPREYLELDSKKVRAAIKQGIRSIEGLRIYEKERLTIRG